ncbi:tripartite ATP-independent periplasmic transporters, DctQ component [mine drainage metagenome]|uniref:Tripartite ATP-independent periplasmic transporters, DctQ component n=1 Tax=mine drainage metagenome TaxID=410659 RepID=A0A1J5QEE9_9ZZZZ
MRHIGRFTAWLILPLTFLLFAQWPLRELLLGYSRQANDAAQVIFALYVAVGVTAASRANTHLCAHLPVAAATHGHLRRRAWAALACVGPWSLFMLWSGTPQLVDSVRSLERFAETDTPGYFLIKMALALMVALIVVQGVLSVSGGRSDQND